MTKRTSDGAPPANKNRGRRVTRSLDKSLKCAFCQSDIPLLADHAVIYPCGCDVCLRCLLKLVGPRSTNDVDCTACNTPIHSHHFHKARVPDTEVVKYVQQQPEQPQTQQQQPDERMWLKNPLKSLFTMNRHLLDSPPAEACELTVLYGARYFKAANETKWTLEKCVIPFTRLGNNSPGQVFSQLLLQFGAFLHRTITQVSTKPYSEMKALAPEQYIRQKIEQLTPLTSFLFGLATSKIEIDTATIIQPITGSINQTASQKAFARKKQSQFAAIASASDLLHRSTVNHPCELQLMLNRRLNMVPLRRDDRDLLSIFNIIASRSFSQSDIARNVLEQMSERIDVDPNGIHFVLTDNLQFKEKANHDPTKLGIKQTTKIIDVIIPSQMLIDAGILSDDGSRILLSTDPSNSWEELRKDKHAAKRLTSTTSTDIDALTECVAESMLTANEDVLNGNLAIGKKRLRSARFINRQTKGELLNRSGVSIEEMNNGDVEAMLNSSDEGSSSARVSNTQPIIVSQIVKKDLARTSTIQLIADYVVAVQEKTLNQIEDPVRRKNCLMAKVGSFILCDGQPAAQFQSLFAEDYQNETPKYKNVKCIFGAFHTILKMHNAMGKIFDYIFKVAFAKYRRTLARILYIQFPGDPRQIEKEFPELLQALYMSAAKYFYLLHRRAPSVKELHGYMLKRAEQYPVVALLMLYTRFAEINKMMKMSERKLPRGNRELYFQTLKFVLPLFAMTHKIDYVRLISDFFMIWECDSPAFHAIYDNFLFCQVSSTGFPVMSDLFVELQIARTRYDCGKISYRGIDADLEASLYKNSVERVQDGTIIERLRTGGQADKQNRSATHVDTTVDSPILQLFEFFHNEAQFFHPSEPPIVGRSQEDNSPIYAEEGSHVTHKNEHMNPHVLYMTVTGSKRAENYFQVYHLDSNNKVGRSEDEVELKSVPVSGADLSKLRTDEIDRKVSLDLRRLMAIMNKGQLIDEIKDTYFTLAFDYDYDESEPKGLNSKNKNDLVNILIKLRKKYFEIDDEAITHIENKTKKELDVAIRMQKIKK